MKQYTLKEIKKIWRNYKTPILKVKSKSLAKELYARGGSIMPGDIFVTNDTNELQPIFNFSEFYSFPEYLEMLEDDEETRKIKKLKE